MFDTERFIQDCREALKDTNPHGAVKELVERAVADPASIVAALGEPQKGEIQTVYRGDDLTVLNILWAPGMRLYPHNHMMWAVIGIYGGREDNTFYRRSAEGLVEQNARSFEIKEVAPLGENVIHAVANPLDKITAGIHVYGGDFFAAPRSQWDPETLQEEPYDIEEARRVFEEANERLKAQAGG
jgi:predicted metal-dependent enzyme (double-stranded beta helix superfamily)